MTSKTLCIDANLLVLWAVGSVSPELIKRHKRLGNYVSEDFALLLGFANRYQALLVTPNILTEASNLARQIDEPARTQISANLADFAHLFAEHYVASRVAVGAEASQTYLRLGLSDSATLQIPDVHLLTDDLDLHVAALSNGQESTKFTHLREAAGITS